MFKYVEKLTNSRKKISFIQPYLELKPVIKRDYELNPNLNWGKQKERVQKIEENRRKQEEKIGLPSVKHCRARRW